jgi:hypothetical protein
MTDPKDKSDQEPFSDSSELFETLFRDEPLEEDKEIKQAPKMKEQVKPRENLSNKQQNQTTRAIHPTQEIPPPRQTLRTSKPATPRVEQAKRAPVKKSSPPKAPEPLVVLGRGSTSARTVETEKANLSLKTKPSKTRGRAGSKGLKVIVLVLVLAVGAGVAANYLGFVDFDDYISFFIGQKPQPAPAKVAHTRPGKKTLPQVQAKPAPEKPIPLAPPAQPAPAVKQPQQSPTQAGQGAVKDGAEVKAPVSPQAAQAKEVPAQVKSQAPPSMVPARETPAAAPPALAAQPKPVPQPPAPVAQPKPVPQPAPPAVHPKPIPQPPPPVVQSKPTPQSATPVQPKVEQARVVPSPQKQQPSQPQAVHVSAYPFSVYLGAFMTLDRAKTAVSIYKKESGISAFWVKVDLGEKGIWYRVFTGYFRSAEEAEAFIGQNQLKEGEVKQTKYSTLIGEYSGKEEAEEVVHRLSEHGYSSYFVTVPGGLFKLYSGTFYTMEGAQKQYAELASKGIKSKAVER